MQFQSKQKFQSQLEFGDFIEARDFSFLEIKAYKDFGKQREDDKEINRVALHNSNFNSNLLQCFTSASEKKEKERSQMERTEKRTACVGGGIGGRRRGGCGLITENMRENREEI